METLRNKIREHLSQLNLVIDDGTHTYRPYATVYPDVYAGYLNDINNPESPLLIDEYYNDNGIEHVQKKAVPYHALNQVLVRDDGRIVTTDDLDHYTYNFDDSNRLLQQPKYHTSFEKAPWYDLLIYGTAIRDQYGNLVRPIESDKKWLDPADNAANDLLALMAGTGRLVVNAAGKIVQAATPLTRSELAATATSRIPNSTLGKVGQIVKNGLDKTLPSYYLGKGGYSTVLGGEAATLLGAIADTALAADMANTAYNELKKDPNVGTIANVGLATIPLLPFRGIPLAIEAGKRVLSMGSEAYQLGEIEKLYPHLTPQEVSKTLLLLKKYLFNPNSLGSRIGLHPLLVDEAVLKTKKLNPKPFDPTLFGFPDTSKTEMLGDVVHTLEPDFNGYISWYTHPDNSSAGFVINSTKGIISPILRPGDTGIVNKAVQFPMVKEIKGMILNPNFKDYVITTDLGGNPHIYNMFESELTHPDFPQSGLSFDSYQLLHKLIDKDKNLELLSVPSIMNFNDMAFVNKDLSDRFLKLNRGLMSNDEIALFWSDFKTYLEKAKAMPAIKGSKTQTIIGSHPMGRIITHKKGSKLIKRKK